MTITIDKLSDYDLKMFEKTESTIWDYYNILKHYADYEEKDSILAKTIMYEDINSPNLERIRNYMNIRKMCIEDDEIKYLTYLKKIAYEKLHFAGKKLIGRIYDHLSVEEIINTAKNEGYALNCRYISHIFCQMLLAVGFRARWIVCLPVDFFNSECHCVTEVYINKLNKWIIADAAFGTYYFGEKREMLNLYEMRTLYIKGKLPVIFAYDEAHIKELQLYWIKNLFRFRFIVNNGTNALIDEQYYWGLNPKGFEMRDRTYVDRFSNIKVDIKYSNDARAFW